MTTTKRKSISRTARGVDAYFTDANEVQDQNSSIPVSNSTDIQTEAALERATFYIRVDQPTNLEELKLKLRRKGIKTDKSELVRMALDMLTSQDIDAIVNLLSEK
ncbi:MAG: hypothetical protein HXX20_24045 [Chloroflexi bacterium]|nr:hypothetical protein [Chloroflexota bacterium]